MIQPKNLRLAGIGTLGLSLASLAAGLIDRRAPGEMRYTIHTRPTVMTVAYKAYGNPEAAEGKYWLARLVLENDGESPLHDVSVSYRIPDYIDWTTPRTIDEMLPGQTRVVPIYPKLPTKVTNLRSRTPSSLELRFKWNDGHEDQQKVEVREFEFRGVNEIEYTSLPADEMLSWYDMYDNAEICAAYVTDEDPVVRQYLGEISETMGGVPICSSQQELLKVMQSIYAYQVATGMKYTGNKGLPEQLGDARSVVQNVRLPRDVVYQNSGLCIELAMLWAAIGQGCSAKAYLALVPGHCFPVLEANDGTIIAIEATGIGGANLGGTAGFEKAVEIGNKQLQQLIRGEIPGVLLDVAMHQGRGIRPPEFEPVDQASLARLMDERTAEARRSVSGGGGGGGSTPERDERASTGGGGGGASDTVDDGNWNWFQVPGLNAAVPYPTDYSPDPQAVAQVAQYLPALQFIASDAAERNSVDVYAAAGISGADLMRASQQFAGAIGAQIRFGRGERTRIGGQDGVLHPYTMVVQGEQLQGGVYIYETSAGVFAVAVGGTDASWRRLGDRIAAAVRFQG